MSKIIGITDKAEFCKDKHLRKYCLNEWNKYLWSLNRITKIPILFSDVSDKAEW
jgi:hypothetical protein